MRAGLDSTSDVKRDDSIKIKALLHKDVSTRVSVGGKKYLIITDDLTPRDGRITTKVYLGGAIVLTRDTDLNEIAEEDLTEKKVLGLLHRQHEMIAELLRKESQKKTMTPSDYLDEVRELLQRKSNRRALELLGAALVEYPDEPFLLSYYGCLEAVANKNVATGIELCERALALLDKRFPADKERHFPTFYLNLGRAYVAAGRKKQAVETFEKGLSYDASQKDLLWEMQKLGVRRKPVFPFLQRTNPLNKYVGWLLHKLKGYA